MLIECGFCGAPLDVRPSVAITKCRYCGKSTRTEAQRTIAPQTPPNWRPPQRWRPPAHVPADSNVELRYHGSALAIGVAVAVVALFVVGAITAGVTLERGQLPGVSGLDPAKLDAVTLLETPSELQAKIGGSFSESAKWVTVSMSAPFQNAVFTYWGDDRSRPSGVTFNFAGKGCTAEKTAIRDRLAERLGPRFDGKRWNWGAAHLSFDASCSNVVVGTEVGKETDAYAKRQAEVLWRVAKREVLGRGAELDETELRGLLGGGFDAKTIAKALAGTNLDDAATKIEAKAPGSFLSKTDVRIPLASPVFSHVGASYANEKGGAIKSLSVATLAWKNLSDPIGLAKCVAKRTGAKLDVQVTDYAAKKSSANLQLGSARVYVGETSFHVSTSYGKVLEDTAIAAIVSAVEACDD